MLSPPSSCCCPLPETEEVVLLGSCASSICCLPHHIPTIHLTLSDQILSTGQILILRNSWGEGWRISSPCPSSSSLLSCMSPWPPLQILLFQKDRGEKLLPSPTSLIPISVAFDNTACHPPSFWLETRVPTNTKLHPPTTTTTIITPVVLFLLTHLASGTAWSCKVNCPRPNRGE